MGRPLSASASKPKLPVKARTLILSPAKLPLYVHIELQVGNTGSFRTIRSFKFNRSNPALNVGFDPWAPVVISIPETTASSFRLLLTNVRGTGGFSEINISSAARIERYPEKQLAKMFQTPLPLWKEYQWPDEHPFTDKDLAIDPGQIIDLSPYFTKDGKLTWNVPKGEWMILRYGMLPTGVTNAPAAPEGRGYDIDKMNKAKLQHHFDSFVGRIQARMPAHSRAALKFIVADSYETGSQNWTDGYAATFRKQYGYDPVPWLPVLNGRGGGQQGAEQPFSLGS